MLDAWRSGETCHSLSHLRDTIATVDRWGEVWMTMSTLSQLRVKLICGCARRPRYKGEGWGDCEVQSYALHATILSCNAKRSLKYIRDAYYIHLRPDKSLYSSRQPYSGHLSISPSNLGCGDESEYSKCDCISSSSYSSAFVHIHEVPEDPDELKMKTYLLPST